LVQEKENTKEKENVKQKNTTVEEKNNGTKN